MGAQPLQAEPKSPERFVFPALDRRKGGDPSWADTLDTLRTPREREQTFWDWRRESSIRPVVFESPGMMTEEVVQLHLEHRVVQRLLGRFIAQGFVHNDLSRACLAQTTDPDPASRPAGPSVSVRFCRRPAARGADRRHRSLDRPAQAQGAARPLRPRCRGRHAPLARRSAPQAHAAAQRGDSETVAGDGAARCGRIVARTWRSAARNWPRERRAC